MAGNKKMPGVYIKEHPGELRPITGVETSITAFVGFSEKGPINEPIFIKSFAEFQKTFGALNNDYPMSFSIEDFFVNGGKKAVIVRIDFGKGNDSDPEITATKYQGNKKNQTGIFALEKVDSFNILCIPPPSKDRDIGKDVIRTAAFYCEKRLALFLIDCPLTWTSVAVAVSELGNPALFIGTNSFHAAIFYPRILKPNPLRDNQLEQFAPSGAIAGVMSRIDEKRGVWKAAAGFDAAVQSQAQIPKVLDDAEMNLLVSLGCNCLKFIPPKGPLLLWGARTLQGSDIISSEWKYIPVHRLGMYIEDSVKRGLTWAIFEPNDEPLWENIRTSVREFLDSLFKQGALQGKTPREAYFVKCDAETTTESDRQNEVLNFWIGFAPLKPAEFIILHIQQKAGLVKQDA